MCALSEDELHDLVLVHHVDRHVTCVLLCPHEGGAEDYAEALSGHQVLGGERQNSGREPNIDRRSPGQGLMGVLKG